MANAVAKRHYNSQSPDSAQGEARHHFRTAEEALICHRRLPYASTFSTPGPGRELTFRNERPDIYSSQLIREVAATLGFGLTCLLWESSRWLIQGRYAGSVTLTLLSQGGIYTRRVHQGRATGAKCSRRGCPMRFLRSASAAADERAAYELLSTLRLTRF